MKIIRPVLALGLFAALMAFKTPAAVACEDCVDPNPLLQLVVRCGPGYKPAPGGFYCRR